MLLSVVHLANDIMFIVVMNFFLQITFVLHLIRAMTTLMILGHHLMMMTMTMMMIMKMMMMTMGVKMKMMKMRVQLTTVHPHHLVEQFPKSHNPAYPPDLQGLAAVCLTLSGAPRHGTDHLLTTASRKWA